MRQFTFRLEQYQARTGQSMFWLRGYLWGFLPVLFLLHILGARWMLVLFAWDTYMLIGCIYTGCAAVLCILTFIQLYKLRSAGYRCALALNILNALRCALFAGLLGYSIMQSLLHPLPEEVELHMPGFLMAIPFLFVIVVEVLECAIHIANTMYLRRRRGVFLEGH